MLGYISVIKGTPTKMEFPKNWTGWPPIFITLTDRGDIIAPSTEFLLKSMYWKVFEPLYFSILKTRGWEPFYKYTSWSIKWSRPKHPDTRSLLFWWDIHIEGSACNVLAITPLVTIHRLPRGSSGYQNLQNKYFTMM